MKKVKVSNYTGERLGSTLFSVLVALGSAHAVEEVELEYHEYVDERRAGAKRPKMVFKPLDLMHKNGYTLLGHGYGQESIRNVTGTMILSDGRIITCITSDEGADTFNSGELVTAYYLLTPK